MTRSICHLAEPDDWERRTDVYICSSLEEEGFIHCSTDEQLADVASRHYPDRSDLILLTIDPAHFGEDLVYEDLYDFGDEFPHIYAPLPLAAVISADPYPKIADPRSQKPQVP